jgi:cytochrome c biogenesis protein CcmG, thiol:disulfide interchange protein DsbE
MRRLLWLIPVVLLFVVVGVGLFRARPQAELGRAAPAFSLPALDEPDERIDKADLKGKPAVINFWASWCEPCRAEAEALGAEAREHSEQITFLGIAMLDGRSSALEFADEFNVPYDSARDARGVTAKRYGVTGVPETVFLDERGRLVGKFIGAIDRSQLKSILEDLIELGPDELLSITGRGETRPVP